MIYPNGIIIEYGYDNLNCLISVETRTLMSDIIASYAYTLNSKGQRTHVEERVGTQLVRTIDYTYDAVDRLIEEQIDDVITGARTISYTGACPERRRRNPVGNRLTKDDNGVITTYDYDDNDRLLTEGGFSYDYDSNGNLLSKTGNGEQYDFSYNALNQLVHADINTGGSSSTVDYVYDHDGIRAGKTINGTDVTTYIVDKNRPYAQVLEEQWTNGALSATTGYVYGDDLISRTTNSTTHFYHYDGMGSTRTLTDMSGIVTDTYQYDAYGNLLDKTGSTINPYLYRGEQYDDDLSAYYLRARYYQPWMGRFMTTDVIEGFPNNPITLHRYVYGNDNPINFRDPSGKMSLHEKLVVTGIVLNLAAMPIGAFTDIGQTVFSSLAKHVYPEAYIVGGNLTGTLPPPLSWFIDEIFTNLPVPVPVWAIGNGIIGVGYEILLSLGSGEAALFNTFTLGGAIALPSLSGGLELYDGLVFNLWNAYDYKGPFESLSLNLDMKKVKGGWNLFWDAKRSFKGPWGGASTFFSTSLGINSPVSFGKSNTSYTMVGEPFLFGCREETIYAIGSILMITKMIEMGYKGSPMPGLYFFLELSTWANIAIAHDAWNKKEPEYNIDERRKLAREEVLGGYQSGPPLWSWIGI